MHVTDIIRDKTYTFQAQDPVIDVYNLCCCSYELTILHFKMIVNKSVSWLELVL